MLLNNSSTRVPSTLTPVIQQGYIPGFSIYKDSGSPVISVDSSTLTIDGQVFSYTTKGLPILAAEIQRSLTDIKVCSHIDVTLQDGDLFYSATDTTPEGGYVIRYLGLAMRVLERTRIRLLLPHDEGPSRAWFARINVGGFHTTLNGVGYTFGVPEYYNQTWSLKYGHPYMAQGLVETKVISNRVLQLPRGPVLWVKGSIALFRNGTPLNNSIIEDVDENNRLVYLLIDIDQTDTILASYIYRENSYLYKMVNLNPTLQHSPGLVGKFILFYLKPYRSTQGLKNTRTVYHITGNSLESAIGKLSKSTDPVVLLGALRTRQVEEASDISVEDCRRRGGGVKEDVDPTRIQPESWFYSDIGNYDGRPYPGNASVIINVPRTVLDTFTSSEVTTIAKRHLAAGTVPIIEYID